MSLTSYRTAPPRGNSFVCATVSLLERIMVCTTATLLGRLLERGNILQSKKPPFEAVCVKGITARVYAFEIVNGFLCSYS